MTLKVDKLCSGYGEVMVLDDLSFSVGNEVFSVLGANGAGKTTLLKTLAKLLPIASGNVYWQDQSLRDVPAYDLPHQGVSYVPQEHNVFPDLSVAENLAIGGSLTPDRKDQKAAEIYELFPRLADRTEQLAGSLSGGEGQMLAVGRALMQDPKILLLDEPSAGLSPLFVDILFQKIVEIREQKGVTIVLAEQNSVKALEISDRILVLSLGKLHFLKDAGELETKDLMEAYHI